MPDAVEQRGSAQTNLRDGLQMVDVMGRSRYQVHVRSLVRWAKGSELYVRSAALVFAPGGAP